LIAISRAAIRSLDSHPEYLAADISYQHFSQPMVGPPFNDDTEDSLDAFYAGVEYHW